MAPQQVQWGTITLHLDNETFRKSFSSGRSMYFDDSECDIPHIAHHMSTLDAVRSVADENGKGGYRFDRMVFNGPFAILGFFLGYMSGPIIAESGRSVRNVTGAWWNDRKWQAQEVASPIGIALESVLMEDEKERKWFCPSRKEEHAADYHR